VLSRLISFRPNIYYSLDHPASAPEPSIPEPLPTQPAPPTIEETTVVAPEPEAQSDEAVIEPIMNVQSGIQPLSDFVGELDNPPQPSSTDAVVPNTQEPVQVGDSVDNMGAVVSEEDKVMENTTSIDGLNGTVDESTVASSAVGNFPKLETEDVSMADAAPMSAKVAREREDDEDGGPAAKRARTEEVAPAEVAPAEVASADINGGSAIAETAHLPTTEQPAAPPALVNVPAVSTTPTYQPPSLGIDFGVMTESQYKIIEGGMRNLKKSRNAVAFQKPVDPVALGIPRYLEVITHPMDLSTMERKIKTREYKSVNDYVSDFWTMVSNSVTFNGAQHPVSLSGIALMQQLDAQLRKASRPGDSGAVVAEPAPKKKKQTPIPPESKQRRQSRPSLPKPLPALPTIAKEETYALDTNGMPQIRRMSTSDGRPKREIKAPARELPYSAKPKKKKYQAELKYCQEIINEFKKPKWAPAVSAFLAPVDPVALNIPTYRSIVKKPMDLGTMQEKLNRGEYENCKEFEADFRLMCDNCYKFNGKEHIVSKMAQDLEAHLTSLLSRKNDWIAKHAPRSSPQSPDAGSDSEPEDDEEEEEEEGTDQFDAIHKQMAALSEQLMALQQKGKLGKSKDKKGKSSGKASKKNSLGGGSLPIRSEKKSKGKVTKSLKPITTAQKEEISTKIGTLSEQEIGQAAIIIKRSLRKAGKEDLANRADDEMEFEIDEIPDDALHELLKLVRGGAPPPEPIEEVVEDTEYRPAKTVVPANSGKSRKNKPMSKHEQEARINELKGKLNDFQNRGSGSSPPGKLSLQNESNGRCADTLQVGHAAADSSGDEEESGSESEEE